MAGKWLHIDELLTPKVYHDLGKLIFAFCMFWGYTTFAQYLPIWYGNMTEETGFILLRTSLDPWAGLTKVVVILCFFMPWTLLSRGMKKIRSSFHRVSFVILVGIWLERFLVMVPSVWKGDELPIGVGEVLMPIGFGGIMVLLVMWVLSKIPCRRSQTRCSPERPGGSRAPEPRTPRRQVALRPEHGDADPAGSASSFVVLGFRHEVPCQRRTSRSARRHR